MYNFYWLPLVLPQIPHNIKEEFLRYEGKPVINKTTDRMLKDGNKEYHNGFLTRYKMDFGDWVRQNITEEFDEISAQIIENGSSTGPHTDRYRRWHLFYLLESGGDNVETVWYQEPDKPVWRDEFVVFSDYSKLNELYRCVLPTNTWILFNSRIIHDVQNMSGTRKTLTVDLYSMPEEFRTLAESANFSQQKRP
jgi:hypothetical protein